MPDLVLQKIQTEHIGPVNLTVNSGEITCLSGPSGAGKSLLLRMIVDVIPHIGDVALGEIQASKIDAPAWRKKVGMLPAESQWWFDTVGEHFNNKDEALLNKLGFMHESWDWQLSRCSSGEKQRLALLRLLVNRPACLLLDEPTGSLDPDNTKIVESIIKDYASEKNIPVLWVSHSEEQIKRICAKRYIMQTGELSEQ